MNERDLFYFEITQEE